MLIELILLITLIAILVLIELETSKEMIYRYNPCDFSYNKKLVLFTFTFFDPKNEDQNIEYHSECIMYVNNKMDDNDIASYLFEHKELYSKEYNTSKNHYRQNHSTVVHLKQIAIKIENYDNLFHIQ